MRWFLGLFVAAAVTLPWQLNFTANGTGAVQRKIASKLGDVVSVCDYIGNTCPSGGDDGVALQAALDAVAAGGSNAGKNLLVPAGTYNYATPLVPKNLRSLTVFGDGNRNSILHYTGAAGGTAFKCLNCYRTKFVGIRFDRSTNDPTNMVAIIEDSTQGDYDSTAPSQLNTFEECTFKNGAVGLLIDFVTNDAMNDSHRFVHNIFDGQTATAFSISGQNAMGLSFYDNYSTNAPHAVQVQAAAGSFKWYDGYVNSTVSNFELLSINTDGYVFTGTRSESSPRFLSYAGASGSQAPIVITGVAYSAASLNADGNALAINGGGPVTVTGGCWGGCGASDPTPPRFSIANSSSNPIPVNISGVAFGATNANTVVPLRASTGNRSCAHGNQFKVGSTSVWTTLPEECFEPVPRELTIPYTSGVAMNLDASQASTFKLVVNDTVAVVLNVPTNGTTWQLIRIQIKATAAMNAANPFGGTGWRAGTVPIPTNGNGYIYLFMSDGVSWYQIGTPNLVAN